MKCGSVDCCEVFIGFYRSENSGKVEYSLMRKDFKML